jgi:hypothetical protein
LSNVCADAGSHRQAISQLNERASAAFDRPVEAPDSVSDPIVMDAIATAMNALPDTQRGAFVLREVADLTYEEVADRMGISEDNARSRVHRARTSLQQALSSSREALGAAFGIPVALRMGVRRLFTHTDSASTSSTSATAATVSAASSPLSTAVGQLAATPIAQAVMAAAPAMPRGSLLVGVAASIASVTTGLVAGSSPVPAAAVEHSIETATSSPNITVPAPVSTTTTTVSPPVEVSAPTITTPTPIKAPTPADTPATPTWVKSGASSPVLAAPPAYCAAVSGLDPSPTTGAFATPAPFDGQSGSVLNSNQTDLSSVGDSQEFSTTTSFTNANGTSVPINVQIGVCLPPTSGALFVKLTDAAGDEVDLAGGYVEAIGDSANQGYLFRGTATVVKNASGGSVAPFGSTSEFVAQVAITQPDNTGTLTVAFMGTPASGQGPTSTSGTGTSDTTSDASTSSTDSASDPTTDTGGGTSGTTSGENTSGDGSTGESTTTEGDSLLVGSGSVPSNSASS